MRKWRMDGTRILGMKVWEKEWGKSSVIEMLLQLKTGLLWSERACYWFFRGPDKLKSKGYLTGGTNREIRVKFYPNYSMYHKYKCIFDVSHKISWYFVSFLYLARMDPYFVSIAPGIPLLQPHQIYCHIEIEMKSSVFEKILWHT